MGDLLLTVTQALQLVALAPCIFIVVFLLCAGPRKSQNLLPVLYFLSLSASFLLPLTDIFGDADLAAHLRLPLLLAESLTVPLSYLLVIQFLRASLPAWPHWLILALPLIGGSPFAFASVHGDALCLRGGTCIAAEAVRLFYQLFSAAMVLLLLVFALSRIDAYIPRDDRERRHKYWLILSLIALNVLLAGLDLLQLSGTLAESDRLLAATGLRIAFIYIVLTSIFRVFYDIYEIQLLSVVNGQVTARSASIDTARDQEAAARLREIMEREEPWRDASFSVKHLARLAGIAPKAAARILQACFQQDFADWVNAYRIASAKEKLRQGTTPIPQVAQECGFETALAFDVAFRRELNTGPEEFREFYKNSSL